MSVRELLSMDEMLASACAEASLDDFGADEFREPLQRLIDSTNNDPFPLSEMGTAVFKGEVQRMLVNRLRFARDLKAHPQILDENVDDPIVIIGMPRTGTTKLQRMLAADPDAQRLDYWRIFNPAPFPNAVPGQEDPRKAVAREAVAMMGQLMPQWLDSHPTDADDVDEEVFLQLYTFKCKLFNLLRPVPSYTAWVRTQTMHDTYAYTRRQLQYLQWQDGGRVGKNGSRPWIMKSPLHLAYLDVLIETFPKATLVCTHRDLHEVIPSLCRLTENTHRLYLGAADLPLVGRLCLASFAADIERFMQLRDRMGAKLDILDVQYADIRDDALGVIRRIYQHAGRELTQQAMDAMQAWEAGHPHRGGGRGACRLEEYGLSTAAVDAAFKDYQQRFVR